MSAADTSLGLKELNRLSQILIRQNTKKIIDKYVVLSPEGNAVLHAREESGILDRMFVGTSRAFEMTLYDNDDKEVIKLRRPYTMGPEKMDVTLCGQPVSVVRKEVTFLKPIINVNDANDRPAYRVKGPLVTSNDCDFEIYTREKERVGIIGRRWGGAEDAKGYELQLPGDLDIRYKAALLGTCFLIEEKRAVARRILLCKRVSMAVDYRALAALARRLGASPLRPDEAVEVKKINSNKCASKKNQSTLFARSFFVAIGCSVT